jgi:hypothetical protein
MELGGMIPTSVTTAVMLLGGVKSYNGFRISRLVSGWRVRVLFDRFVGKVVRNVPIGATFVVSEGKIFHTHTRTQFILGETVELNPFGKFVCLATYQDRNRVLFGHHCHQCCPCPGEHGTVGMQRVCADQHQIDFGDD